MALTKFLARDLDIVIVLADSGSTELPIKGLNTLTHSPSSTDADTTDFESNGHNEHLKAERGDQWTLAGFHLEDVITGDRDPGQAACEALAQETSFASLGSFKITSPGGNTIEFKASAEVTLAGGNNNEAATWQCILKVSGATTFG